MRKLCIIAALTLLCIPAMAEQRPDFVPDRATEIAPGVYQWVLPDAIHTRTVAVGPEGLQYRLNEAEMARAEAIDQGESEQVDAISKRVDQLRAWEQSLIESANAKAWIGDGEFERICICPGASMAVEGGFPLSLETYGVTSTVEWDFSGCSNPNGVWIGHGSTHAWTCGGSGMADSYSGESGWLYSEGWCPVQWTPCCRNYYSELFIEKPFPCADNFISVSDSVGPNCDYC